MLVYHGSNMEVQIPDINYGRFNLDFGRGFYVTTLQKQAEKWSQRRALMENKTPIVSIYELDINFLNILFFEGYTEEWLDFVVKNRARIKGAANHSYDVIFGNIADDDIAATIDEYMRLLSKGRVNADVKRATLYQLSFGEPNDQYCIATQKGVEQLNFIKSYEV